MLLALDIGNTNIKLALFDENGIVSKSSFPTVRDIGQNELAEIIAENATAAFDEAIFCSVVPELDRTLTDCLASRFAVQPIQVTNDADFGLEILYKPLSDAGADRLVNSFSAAETYGVPVIVCSFGTALTIDVIDASRKLLGGLIAPGLQMLPRTLRLATSRLPEVDIQMPASAIQTTTVGSLQSGIAIGFVGMFEALLGRVKSEADGESWRVVATGGAADFVAENSSQIDLVDRDLTINGLARLNERLSRRARDSS
jgi:type III pantothenate kinase